MSPVLYLVVGPNGAGKSTFTHRVLQARTHLPLVNADLIAHERWPGRELEHGWEAARAASEERARLLNAKASFITETVFSHPSKVALVDSARTLGYLVDLHVILVPPALPQLRVEHRVRRGGHDVPPDKIAARYARLWPLVADAVRRADRTVMYDNTRADRPFRAVARYVGGRLVERPAWPSWTPASLLDALGGPRG